MKKFVLILFIILYLPLYAANITNQSFIGKWKVIENGHESVMTISKNSLTWKSKKFGTSVHKFRVYNNNEDYFEIETNASPFSFKILKITRNEIYLERFEGKNLKLTRIK